MAQAGNLQLVEVQTQAELQAMVVYPGFVYVGSTVNPGQRGYAHSASGFYGTLYYAPTQNMMAAEDRLLDIALGAGRAIHNDQQRSNAAQEPGFVYAIKGGLRGQ